MTFPYRDRFASGYVAAAVVLYLLWLFGLELPGLSSVRAVGLVILALGFAASATAVVPGFAQLLHGSKLYLGAASVLGLAALIAGIRLLTAGAVGMLHALMAAMLLLWVMATARHMAATTKHATKSTHAAAGR